MKILKSPLYENDSYLLLLENFKISNILLKNIIKNNEYLKIKDFKFSNKDISCIGFEKFQNEKKSLIDLKYKKNLQGSIYTYCMEYKNNISLEKAIRQIKNSLNKKSSRRLIIRILDDFSTYYSSEKDNSIDVSCLAFIQYLKNKVNIVFRASDIKNELFFDIITIYKFFILPVYKNKIDIEIYATTSQNIIFLKKVLTSVLENNNNGK